METSSKWLDFGAAGGVTSWLEVILPEPCSVTAYTLTSADDSPERDPCDFTLEAVLEKGGLPEDETPKSSPEQLEWNVSDAREGHRFSARLQTQSFEVGVDAWGPCNLDLRILLQSFVNVQIDA